ncbi:MAG: tetratricopeptide repeat protein [Bacteroidales bacterium]
MNERFNDMEWIDRYLSGDLDPGELDEFERRMRQDKAFRALVSDLKVISEGIRASARDSLLQDLMCWEEKYAKRSGLELQVRRNNLRRVAWVTMAAAASLALLFYVGIIRPSGEERLIQSIYREYSLAPENVSVLSYRSGRAVEEDYHRAFEAYDLGKYRKAASLFSALEDQSDTVLFYLGSSLMEIRQYSRAADCFRQVLSKGGYQIDQSRWQLALALIKAGDLEGSREILLMLTNYPNYFREKSLEILKKTKTIHP